MLCDHALMALFQSPYPGLRSWNEQIVTVITFRHNLALNSRGFP